ncbi:MAG: phosphoethanolamine--lipid A transferase [Deltaproteobacteria bacterium]|jgi:lipid A ethanolaminephosphotransferase|nr:phosphoethanolamine--lipid A transferase [Deltaproteobacteria bacterium]
MKLKNSLSDNFYGNKKITSTKIIIFTSIFFVLCDNITFFQHVLDVYPLSSFNLGFLISLGIGISAVITFLLTLVTSRYTTKPVLILLIMLSSFAAYFMDNYNVVIDDNMIQNIVETDLAEAFGLLNIKILYYFLLLGLLPSLVIYRMNIESYSWKKTVLYKTRDGVIALLVLLAMIFSFSKFYTSFFREHKPLRYYTNPTYYIYSAGKYINRTFNVHEITVSSLGTDAKVVELDDENDEYTELIILVVGEAARADHFSLNGYQRETNPLLQQENIINFTQMSSCGTSTAYSVPCMFSFFPRKKFNHKKGVSTENILDVLSHTGFIDILWRDNNSDSKGVAERVSYEDFRKPENNTICSDGECRDEGMLVGLDQYIAQHKGRDILIILHQMGNHGPEYYKRYPKEFERFTPTCKTNQLEECSNEQIINAYDNALLYTDYFLAKVISFLKQYDTTHETAMIYFSDHGESLGEKGLYLHGIPYVVAPEAQTHIGSLMWFGDKMSKDLNIEKIRQNKDKKYSHDNLFQTLLAIFEVETEVYIKDMDILNN